RGRRCGPPGPSRGSPISWGSSSDSGVHGRCNVCYSSIRSVTGDHGGLRGSVAKSTVAPARAAPRGDAKRGGAGTPSGSGAPRVPIGELVRYYLRLGALGFGGPVALVGQMERELVEGRRWLTKEEMREAIAVCQSLPGPLAIQVGIFISYLRGGFWGALAGGSAFLLPNFPI